MTVAAQHGVSPAMAEKLVSTEPSTGAELWSGEVGDAAAEVAVARAAWPEWAAHSIAYRIETLRRFANVVRKRADEFADLISRETGKPLWETKTEVGAVVNKVEISVAAYADRTPMKKLEAALGSKVAIRHKPHGVLAVLGPFNFPAHLPNGHIVPALIAGNAVVFKPSEKTPATGEYLVDCYREAGVPEGVIRLLIGGPDQGRSLASQPGIDGLLFTGSARRRKRPAQAIRRYSEQDPRARAWRQQPDRRLEREGHGRRRGDHRPVRLSFRGPALHGGPSAHRRGGQGSEAGRQDHQADGPSDRRRAVRSAAALHGLRDRQCLGRPSCRSSGSR